MAIATAGGGTTTYFGYDPQGNVTTLTDSAGAVVGSYNYDAWGNLLASSGPRSKSFHVKQDEIGLHIRHTICYFTLKSEFNGGDEM